MSKILMAEGVAPGTPATGVAAIFIDASGNLCKIDDAGNVMTLAFAGSFTLTIPASGVANLLGLAQTITAAKTMGSSAPLIFSRSDLTIAAGAIAVTGNFHRVDTEAAAATDDLDTINGGSDGQRLILSSVSSARDVTIKNGTGNIVCGSDFILSNTSDLIELINVAGTWRQVSRSDNA